MSSFIHTTAQIGNNFKAGENILIYQDVKVGNNVTLGNNVVIYSGTEIGNEVFLADNVILGKLPKLAITSTVKLKSSLNPLKVGANSSIGTGSIIYRGTEISHHVTIGDLVTIRENCQIGEFSLIGRGVAIENNVSIGKYSKIQTNAYITALTIIEDYVFIAPMVTTTNDNFMGRTERRFELKKGPHIKRGARVGGNSILLPGVTIGEDAFVAAGSIVTRDVPARKLVMGIPAKVVRDVPDDELLKIEEEE